MSEATPEASVPPFIQIIAAVSNAFGRTTEDILSSDVLYGLDAKGRVWQWNYADPDCEGSRDGWELMSNETYIEGKEPPAKPRSR